MDEQPVCNFCEKKFNRKKNLYEHLRNVHKTNVEIGSIICPLCSFTSNDYASLRIHIFNKHKIENMVESFSFNTMQEFFHWKEYIEKSQHSSYYCTRTVTLSKKSKKRYYSCHRSGIYNSQSISRLPKAQGSCKIQAHCPSTIECTEGEVVQVKYFKTHCGHEMELKHLTLSKSEKKGFARRISEGVPVKKCLDDVRDSVETELERIHLVTRQDLRNIGASHNAFKQGRLHENDATSVKLFVEQMQEHGNESPIIFYKPQGEISHFFLREDFCLIIMTSAQKELLLKFAEKKICIDSTHGTTAYDFYLTTIVVVDEYNAGFPVAFCLSSKVDTEMMQFFFSSIQDKTCKLKTKIFMSDDAPVYYNAWLNVMGSADRQLLCTWHVDRSWRNNLKKIKCKNKQAVVYKHLRSVMEETDPENFRILLADMLNKLCDDDDTSLFGEYFKSYYANRVELWAFSFRHGAGINTNMYLEAMHKVLKHIYMGGKISKRVDKCIHLLLKMVKDKSFDRFTKLIKGGYCGKQKEIHSRHKSGMEFRKENIRIVNSSFWEVMSESCSKIIYNVNKFDNVCNCALKCNLCNICIHNYSCSCIDSVVKGNICKHIHAVHGLSNSISFSASCKPESVILSDILDSDSFRECVKKETVVNGNIKSKLNYALSLANKNLNSEEKTKLNKHLDSIIDILSDNQCVVSSKSSEPANKKIKIQTRFFSTKKKRISSNSLSKPSSEYKLAILKASRENQDTLNIHDGFDHIY